MVTYKDSINFKPPTYDNIAVASNVLSNLKKVIDGYGYARVSDLFEISCWPALPIYSQYGWVDLTGAEIIHDDRDNFTLNLPPAYLLDASFPKIRTTKEEKVAQKEETPVVNPVETQEELELRLKKDIALRKARAIKLHYDSLVEVGFSEQQALDITLATITSIWR